VIPQLPISPRHIPLREAKITAQVNPLPLIDVDHCDGQFCKLKDRAIPPNMQQYDLMLPSSVHGGRAGDGGLKIKLCRLCLIALNGNERHLFDDNSMMLNGIKT